MLVWSLAVVLSLSLAAFAGCGGGDSETLTKAQFIRRADAICVENSENLIEPINEYMARHANSSLSKNELTAHAVQQTMLPQFQTQVDQIRNLGAPAGDEKEVRVKSGCNLTPFRRFETDPLPTL